MYDWFVFLLGLHYELLRGQEKGGGGMEAVKTQVAGVIFGFFEQINHFAGLHRLYSVLLNYFLRKHLNELSQKTFY